MPIPGLLPGARRVRIPTIHREIPYDYIVFKEDNIIKVFNTKTKEIEFQNPDPVNVFQVIHNKYPVDTKSINLYIKAGDYISNNRLQIKNNRMRFFGEGTPHSDIGTLEQLPDGRYYHRGYTNLLFGIDAYQPIDAYNIIFGNNTYKNSPSVALLVDLSETIYPNEFIWRNGFEFINCQFMNGNPGLLFEGVNTPHSSLAFIESLNNRLIHCSFQFNKRALDINPGTSPTGMHFSSHMEDISFFNNEGDGTKPCINITPDLWSGVFNNILVYNCGSDADTYALYVGASTNHGLEIANVRILASLPFTSLPKWDAGFRFPGGMSNLLGISGRKGIFLSGGAIAQISAPVLALSPYDNHYIIFTPGGGDTIPNIKFLDPGAGDIPFSPDRRPQAGIMRIDLNSLQFIASMIGITSNPYTLKYTDVLLFVNASGGNITINIPREYGYILGTIWTIKRVDSSANTVTVNIGTTSRTLGVGEVLRITGLGVNDSFTIL